MLLAEVQQQLGELGADVLEDQLLDARFEILAAQDQRARELVGGAAVDLEQAVEQLARDLDRRRGVHRLGHLLARAAVQQAGLAEEVALGAVGERQLLAVARDLGDLDAALRQEVDPLGAVARQVDDLARPVGAHRDAGQQRLQGLGRDVGQHVAPPQQRESLLFLTARHLLAVLSRAGRVPTTKTW